MANWILGIIKDLATAIFNGLVSSSYWLCLFTSLLAVIFYVCGQKKAGKWISMPIVIYVLLQAINGVVKQ